MARPKKKVSESRRKLMQIRLMDSEYADFAKAAKASGLDLSAWVRERLRKIAKRELREEG